MGVVVITGTSSGIGQASALAFARAGHRTIATLRDLAKAEPLREARESEGLDLELQALDVASPASVAEAVGAILAREGRVDVLVNNAGIGGACPLEDVLEEEHRWIFEVNYFGALRMIQAVLPGMREQGSGAIVNVSSGAGRFATPNQVPYSASKFALEGASEALAHELAPFGVRVAIVEPGVVATAIFENSAAFTRYDKHSPYRDLMRRSGMLYSAGLKRPGDPHHVAEVIVEAALGDAPRLRYLVGQDAENLVTGRAGITDEQFVALGETMSDDTYRELFREYFGIEL
ncbi:SDR family oxidoreductase [Myxococcota bacterium]|nr:SDR family oxidoreductase [Myxococcota bacterium]